MSTFSTEIKRDLLLRFPKTENAVRAALSALIATSSTRQTESEVLFVSENERIAEYFLSLAERAQIHTEFVSANCDPKRKKDRLVFSCLGEEAKRLYQYTKPTAETYLSEKEAALFYLRAAFLGGGSCTLPHEEAKTGYHLEFNFFSKETAAGMQILLEHFELFAKQMERGERSVVYLKSSEAISDFLFITEARTALKKFEAVSRARERSNRDNRVSNCFAGNADRTVIASAMQVQALQKMERERVLETLPEPLQEAAKARIENPTLSLAELAKELNLSKSCLNHRLRNLMQRAKQTKDN